MSSSAGAVVLIDRAVTVVGMLEAAAAEDAELELSAEDARALALLIRVLREAAP